MIRLPNEDQSKAKTTALRIVTTNASRILSERSATRQDKEEAALALMSIDWAPSITRMIGSRPLNRLLQHIRQDILPRGEYRIFADMIARAADDSRACDLGHWALWKGAIIRYRLFEFAPLRSWVSLAARLYSVGLSTPAELARLELHDLDSPDWSVDSPDLLLWLWQGARLDYSRRPQSSAGHIICSADDLQALIFSLRTDDISLAGDVRNIDALKRSLGLPADFEYRAHAAKLQALRDLDSPQARASGSSP